MRKTDFTSKDRSTNEDAIAAQFIQTASASQTEESKDKRKYNRLDPRQPRKEEYRYTIRVNGDQGRFINELAYRDRTSINAEIQRLIAAEMKKRPDILEGLDELND